MSIYTEANIIQALTLRRKDIHLHLQGVSMVKQGQPKDIEM